MKLPTRAYYGSAVVGLTCMLTLTALAQPILVIESYHREYPWDQSYKEGIQEVLGNRYTLEYFEMDTKRIATTEYEQRAKAAYEIYQTIKPQLVILGDDNALKYVGPKLAGGPTPVVYLGINANPRDYVSMDASNITGVLERPLLQFSIADIQKIVRPKPSRFLVLFDSEHTSIVSVEEYFKGQTHLKVGTAHVALKLIGDWDIWQETVLNAKQQGYEVLVVGLYQRIFDKNGHHVDPEAIIRWTSENTPIPPFAFWDFAVGADKTIGGRVLFGKEQGRLAAQLALEILSGTAPKAIFPKKGEQGKFLFSRTQLAKHGITLPKSVAHQASFVE